MHVWLGNTEYEFYNSMVKFFDEWFVKLGDKCVKELGLGDDGIILIILHCVVACDSLF